MTASSKPTITVFSGKTATYTSPAFEAPNRVMTFQVVGTLGAGDSVAIQVSVMNPTEGATFETIYTFDSTTDKVENVELGEGCFYKAVFTSANSNSTSLYSK